MICNESVGASDLEGRNGFSGAEKLTSMPEMTRLVRKDHTVYWL
jgi:hypothetical protein